jgi:hypothetical protein
VEVTVGGHIITICDQGPLYSRNIALSPGFTFPALIELLNGYVFFWPGLDAGPIKSGRNHFERYRDDHPSVIRVPTASLFALGPSPTPLFSRYNTGAPRFSRGQASPRGPDVFLSHERFPGVASDVIEVGFRGSIRLPTTAEVSNEPFAAWRPLFSSSAASTSYAYAPTDT